MTEFRGKRVNGGKWVIGTPLYDVLTDHRECTKILNYEDNTGDFRINIFSIIPSTASKRIDFPDVNGFTAFEGDLIKDNFSGIGVIKSNFHEDFYIEWHKNGEISLEKAINYYLPRSKIIGNIHDNPELLEESNAT